MNKTRKLLLRACLRCEGDLFPDEREGELACLQCGRRFPASQIVAVDPSAARVLVKAA